jgi:amino acid adenylation domain-containing protein
LNITEASYGAHGIFPSIGTERWLENTANDSKTGKFRVNKREEAATSQSFGLVRAPSESASRTVLNSEASDFFNEFTADEVEQSVPERFEKIVRLHPDRLAVNEGDRSLTYNALNQTANRIARAILAQCGDDDECVALLFNQSIDGIAAMLAALKARKIDVMLDPANPFPMIRDLLEDSQARLVVTNNRNFLVAGRLADDRIPVLNVDELDSDRCGENLNLPTRPESAARIIYTSGTTGEPKGVVVNHRRILHTVRSNTNSYLVRPRDKVALLSSLRTDQGMTTSYVALLNGAAVCLFDVGKKGVTDLANWINTEQISIYISLPAVFRAFANALVEGQAFPHLRVIKLTSDQVTRTDVELFRRHFPHCLLKIFLGSTEASSLCHYAIDRATELTSDLVPVGYPVEGIEILLLDENGKEVGNDQIGEILIRSRYLALGYWRKPDLTGAKFLPDPEGGDKRMYRTGDLGRRRSDGRFEHLGRIDSRVKIRGYLVEMAEIESVLVRHPAVREAVVLASEDMAGDKKLVAYVVARTRTPTVRELRIYLQETLPGYMIPSAFILLDTMPTTTAGKIDRKALSDSDKARLPLDLPYVEPRARFEKQLAKIWGEVLSIDPVGIHDNFFDLGGHSLLAMRIISQIDDTLGVQLSMRNLLDAPTVAGLASIVESSLESRNRTETNCGAPGEGEETGEL